MKPKWTWNCPLCSYGFSVRKHIKEIYDCKMMIITHLDVKHKLRLWMTVIGDFPSDVESVNKLIVKHAMDREFIHD